MNNKLPYLYLTKYGFVVEPYCEGKDISKSAIEFEKNYEKKIEQQNNKQEEDDLNIRDIFKSPRKDGFINATHLCKIGKKKFKNWYQLDNTQQLIHTIKQLKNIENVVEISKSRHNGSWIHPDLAINLIQWISPVFALQISSLIIKLSNDKSIKIDKEDLNKISLKSSTEIEFIPTMINKTNKFKNGPCFYILSNNGISPFKIGITKNINSRLRSYKTSLPYIKLHYLLYTKDNSMIETILLNIFTDKRKQEWISISLDEIMKELDNIVKDKNISKRDELFEPSISK